MKWCNVKNTFDIIFSDREEFNKVTDWEEIRIGSWGVVDIGYSDMIIKFESEEMRDDAYGAISWNHIISHEARDNN